jgi:hypothetical protein
MLALRFGIGGGLRRVVVGSLLLLAATPAGSVTLEVTQRALEVRCLDGYAGGAARQWQLQPGPHELVVSMRNDPQPGAKVAEPGVARIRFVTEAGHRYEVEVRADATAFSRKVFSRGEWLPVVRDRGTAGHEPAAVSLVSDEPEWLGKADAACAAEGKH